MLTVVIPESEFFDEESSRFIPFKGATLTMEHSLLSLSKWEEKWHIPFIGNNDLTSDQILDYIKCMTITQNVDDMVYSFLTPENIKQIRDYIGDPRTATWFSDRRDGKSALRGKGSEVITNEIIYYWMVACEIPFDPCQRWHLNKLTTLIRVCSEKNNPDNKKNKMSTNEIMKDNAQLNAARRAALKSKG